MRREIPGPVMAIVSEAVTATETHATLDSLFNYAGAPGDPPAENKYAKALAWLRRTNKDPAVDPLSVLGRIIENYMEAAPDSSPFSEDIRKRREKIAKVLAQHELSYARGGRIVGTVGIPSLTLAERIRERDLMSINEEFDRALRNVESSPREAVSAACNLLEAVFKTYIEDEDLEMPAKQDLQGVWNVVRKHLGFDPGRVQDRDLQEILSGIIAVVNGIGALRTHASSAHGSGRTRYRLEPRHSRLAVHSAHTIALFVLESWDKTRAAKA